MCTEQTHAYKARGHEKELSTVPSYLFQQLTQPGRTLGMDFCRLRKNLSTQPKLLTDHNATKVSFNQSQKYK